MQDEDEIARVVLTKILTRDLTFTPVIMYMY